MRDFDRRQQQMQREHDRLVTFVKFVIGFSFVAVICSLLIYGYVAYTVISDPEGVAKTIGGIIGEGVNTFNERMQ